MPFVAPRSAPAPPTWTDRPRLPPARRARRRAHGLLLSPQGCARGRLAALYPVARAAVSAWRARWPSAGLVGVDAHPRSGRPPRRSPAAPPQVAQSLQEPPNALPPVAPLLEPDRHTRGRPPTLQRLSQKTRSGWKRRRQTPAQSPALATDPRAPARLAALHARARTGAGALGDCEARGWC